MILGSVSSWQGENWQTELRKLVSTAGELGQQLALSTDHIQAMQLASRDFPVRIPQTFLDRIPLRNPDDPVLKQFIPDIAELDQTPGYDADPVQEFALIPVPGLVHKYKGRVLLVVSSHCPVHCRYCFRRHFPYQENRNGRQDWQQAIAYIQSDPSIHEVIYSGGDPLSATDEQLHWITTELARIPHLKRLRIHTRFPVVIPSRITDSCIDWLAGSRLQASLVLHCNHPRELTPELEKGLQALRQSGVTLLSQSVLLKGINDNLPTLVALCEGLYARGVLPYYLHLLDKVQGAAHFDLPEQVAIDLYQSLQAELPGYLVPKLVREEAGRPAKTRI